MADQRPPQTVKKSKGFLNRMKKVFRPGSQSTPPADLAPTTNNLTLEEAEKLRARYTHFRILVIGRANAGKTTVLKRVCNTNEDPVYKKVRYQLHLKPCSYRPYIDRSVRPRRYDLTHSSGQVADSGAVARSP